MHSMSDKAVKTQHSVVCEEREHNLISSPVSTLSLGAPSTMTTTTTWEEMKVRRIHWEIRLKDDK